MSTENEPVLDDVSIDDPWQRMQRLGPALELIALKQDPRKVTEARQLLQSLEQRIKEDEQ